ncbi:hypothetical protein BKA69DRAFT_1077937 [Paraphysoderma sedebokerense]|nr:hypothetical protein BKA69DRAFT_1077937 [Paraphysoderma sedebokerense]
MATETIPIFESQDSGGRRMMSDDSQDRFSDVGKMFIGGLHLATTDESLRTYFEKYGQVKDCVVMRDVVTGKSRGFGFITFDDQSSVDGVLADPEHIVDGKQVDPKRAVPRSDTDPKTNKLFVGGVASEVTVEEFKEFFSQFGTVTDASLMMDRETGRSRGFGFVTFETPEMAEKVLEEEQLIIKDKQVEAKKATPKSQLNNYRTGGYQPRPYHGQAHGHHAMQSQYGGYGNPYGNPYRGGGAYRSSGYRGHGAYGAAPRGYMARDYYGRGHSGYAAGYGGGYGAGYGYGGGYASQGYGAGGGGAAGYYGAGAQSGYEDPSVGGEVGMDQGASGTGMEQGAHGATREPELYGRSSASGMSGADSYDPYRTTRPPMPRPSYGRGGGAHYHPYAR